MLDHYNDWQLYSTVLLMAGQLYYSYTAAEQVSIPENCGFPNCGFPESYSIRICLKDLLPIEQVYIYHINHGQEVYIIILPAVTNIYLMAPKTSNMSRSNICHNINVAPQVCLCMHTAHTCPTMCVGFSNESSSPIIYLLLNWFVAKPSWNCFPTGSLLKYRRSGFKCVI